MTPKKISNRTPASNFKRNMLSKLIKIGKMKNLCQKSGVNFHKGVYSSISIYTIYTTYALL